MKEPDKLPQSGQALVTILNSPGTTDQKIATLKAFDALQQHLKLNDSQAAAWMALRECD